MSPMRHTACQVYERGEWSKTTRGEPRCMTEVAPNPTRREKATSQVRPRAECARKPGEALSAQDLSQECGRSGTQRASNPGRGRKPGSWPKPWGSPKRRQL